MGAWIETSDTYDRVTQKVVAPYVGAWIETTNLNVYELEHIVAPYVGAWIETFVPIEQVFPPFCRTLCGCVD